MEVVQSWFFNRQQTVTSFPHNVTRISAPDWSTNMNLRTLASRFWLLIMIVLRSSTDFTTPITSSTTTRHVKTNSTGWNSGRKSYTGWIRQCGQVTATLLFRKCWKNTYVSALFNTQHPSFYMENVPRPQTNVCFCQGCKAVTSFSV